MSMPSERQKWLRGFGPTLKGLVDKVLTFGNAAQALDDHKNMEDALRESEDRYRDLVEHSTDLICTHTLDGKLLSVNELPAKLLGYSREEMLSKPMRDFLLPEARAQFDESLLRIQKDGFAKGLMVVLTKTGERRIWEYHNTLRTEGVTVPIVRGIAHDVTDQKRMEKALRLSEEKFEKAFRSSPSIISISTLHEGAFLEVNESFEKQSGYGRNEVLGRRALDVGIWIDPGERERLVREVEKEGFARDQEIHIRAKSGQVGVIQISAELIELHGKKCLLTVGQDITERKKAEARLQEYEKAVEGVGEMIRVVDREYRYLLANRAYLKHTGRRREQVVGRLMPEVMGRDLFESTVRKQLDVSFEGKIVKYEKKLRYPGIGERDLFVSYFPIEGPHGIDRVACILQDITERKRAEAKFQALLESAPDAVVVVNHQGTIVLINAKTESLFGYKRDDLLSQPVDLLVPEGLKGNHAEHRDRFFSPPRARPMGAGLDLFGLRKDRTQFPVEISLSPLETLEGALVFSAIRDVTDRKVLEEQLRQAQKMESIGQLAGGIAHDFNNLLTVILGHSDQLIRTTETADPRRFRFREIREAAERARWVTAQLLICGRRHTLEFQVINPNELVQELRLLFERLIDEDILLITDLSPTLGRVKADPGLLEQALMNLVVNAGDAMPSGGILTIKTANIEVDAAEATLHPGAAAGSYVVVSVLDDGVGMPADVLLRIFEPFFTTKGPDKGTGLGLAMVHSIVAQSGGYVTVRSELGHGSTFSLFLPRALDSVVRANAETNEGEIPTGSETCLVVEDAGKVRALTSEYLESGGYTVLQAADGQQALEAARRYEGPIHLLVTDVVMPGMSGPDLARSLAKTHPEVKILLVSGHANETAIRHGAMNPAVPLLAKPFTQDVLLRRVREVLDCQSFSLSNWAPPGHAQP